MSVHDSSTLVYDLEQAVLQRLKDVSAQTWDMNDDPVAIRCPAVNVGLVSAGLKPLNMGSTVYGLEITEALTLLVANPKSEGARRRDVYSLVMAVASRLAGWRPVLIDGNSEVDLDLRTVKLARLRKILDNRERLAFTIEFSVSTTFEALTEAEVDLLIVSLQYMLKPGDDTADASDTMNLRP